VECSEHADRGQRDPPGRNGKPAFVRENPQRLHRLVVVVQRLAHAHQDDVEAGVEKVESIREYAHLADDFSGGQIAVDAHLSGEAERAFHRASDLGRETERHSLRPCRRGLIRQGFRNADRLDELSVRQPQEELCGTVDRALGSQDLGRADAEVPSCLGPKVAAQIAHRVERGHPATMDPLKDLPRVKARTADPFERLFELVQLEVGDVCSGIGQHGALLGERRLQLYYSARSCVRPAEFFSTAFSRAERVQHCFSAGSALNSMDGRDIIRRSGNSCNSFSFKHLRRRLLAAREAP
jgi:hypothetical protein